MPRRRFPSDDGPKRFPVLPGIEDDSSLPRSIPWSAIEAHRAQAESNHCGQTLERLAERSGLCPSELYLALNDLPLFRNGIEDDELLRRGKQLIRDLQEKPR